MSEFEGLVERLPQGPAFRFVDAITARVPGELAEGEVVFAPGHRIFEGHLPGRPLVPGVIVIEALAQLSGVVLLEEGGEARAMGYLADVQRLRFRRVVEPGERLGLSSRLAMRLGTAAKFSVRAWVGEEEVASGSITVGGIGGR